MDRSKSQSRLIYNTVFGMVDRILVCILGLVLRRIFLDNLGAELSGLSSLFSSIIGFLNLATAGFVTAIYPRLYQYNVKDDYDNTNRLMCLTRKFYVIVSLIILCLGVICSLFVDKMIYDNQYTLIFLRTVFLVQILTQCVRILSSPAVALLSAREQGYYNILLDIFINIFIYSAQIVVLIKTKSFLAYLGVALVGYLLYVLFLEIILKRLYPWSSINIFKKVGKIDGLFHDMKYTIVIQVANFIFMSTDSIIISSNVGLVQINLYGNYMTIATAIFVVYAALDDAIRSYFGNKLVVDSSAKSKCDFMSNVTFIYYAIGAICAVEYTCLIDSFISWWLGEQYVLDSKIGSMFGVYLFMQILYNAPPAYLQVQGFFKEDMKANISSAIVNLIISIVAVRYLGLIGVLLGTLIGLTLRFIQRSKSTYEDIGIGAKKFCKDVALYVTVYIALVWLSKCISNYIAVSNTIFWMSVKATILFIIICVIDWMIFHKKDEFIIMIDFIKQKISGGR